MKSKSTKKAPAKSKPLASANGASTKSKKGKAAPMAHEEEEEQVDYQKIVHEVHGNPADEKKRLEHWEPVECPYCGEVFEVHLEAAEDGQTMYEDCRVCCKPISLHVQVEDEDVHVSVARA